MRCIPYTCCSLTRMHTQHLCFVAVLSTDVGGQFSSVFCLTRKQPKQLCYSDPNLFIILRVSPAVVSFLPHIHACYRLWDHSVTWMLQTFFFFWCNRWHLRFQRNCVDNAHDMDLDIERLILRVFHIVLALPGVSGIILWGVMNKNEFQ